MIKTGLCVVAALWVGLAAASAQTALPATSLQSAGELHFAADFGAPPNQFIDAQGKMDGLGVSQALKKPGGKSVNDATSPM